MQEKVDPCFKTKSSIESLLWMRFLVFILEKADNREVAWPRTIIENFLSKAKDSVFNFCCLQLDLIPVWNNLKKCDTICVTEARDGCVRKKNKIKLTAVEELGT